MSNNNKKVQKNMLKTLSVIAILLPAIALDSSSTLPNGSGIDALATSSNSHINDQTGASLPRTLVQNLTEANLPVTLPLTKGYVNGFEVFYISTEASDKGLADHLTNFTHSRVSYTPALRNAPPQSLGNIYVFANGIKGPGPLGFQANVADSQPGDSRVALVYFGSMKFDYYISGRIHKSSFSY